MSRWRGNVSRMPPFRGFPGPSKLEEISEQTQNRPEELNIPSDLMELEDGAGEKDVWATLDTVQTIVTQTRTLLGGWWWMNDNKHLNAYNLPTCQQNRSGGGPWRPFLRCMDAVIALQFWKLADFYQFVVAELWLPVSLSTGLSLVSVMRIQAAEAPAWPFLAVDDQHMVPRAGEDQVDHWGTVWHDGQSRRETLTVRTSEIEEGMDGSYFWLHSPLFLPQPHFIFPLSDLLLYAAPPAAAVVSLFIVSYKMGLNQ